VTVKICYRVRSNCNCKPYAVNCKVYQNEHDRPDGDEYIRSTRNREIIRVQFHLCGNNSNIYRMSKEGVSNHDNDDVVVQARVEKEEGGAAAAGGGGSEWYSRWLWKFWRDKIQNNTGLQQVRRHQQQLQQQLQRHLLLENDEHMLPSIHPGHVLLLGSLPFCIQAYRGYTAPLDPVVHQVVAGVAGTTATTPPAAAAAAASAAAGAGTKLPLDQILRDDAVRRAIGSAVAGRALRVATAGSVGVFGITAALVVYASGCSTGAQLLQTTQDRAHTIRRNVDSFFGVKDRVDRDHPEVRITVPMSEQEEMDHVVKTYFPNEEWVPPDDKAAATTTTTASAAPASSSNG
jgi:hypothetical protein